MLSIGHRIQTYEVLAHIGSGGFADVYRVRHVPSGRLFALKWLRPEHRTPDILERFRREAQLQRRLQSPCVVAVLEVTRDEGDPPSSEGTGLVMALYEAGSLADLLAGRSPEDPLSPAFLRRLFVPLLEGLAEVHARGIVHRDIKPGNILLRRTSAGHLEGALTDFGIAHAPDPGPRMTRDGQQMGTLEYMSPEQRLNPRTIDHRSDIYALGAALWECATLHPPDLDAPDLTALFAVDPLFAAVLQRALHPDRDQRFASCVDMAAALRQEPVGGILPATLHARLEALEQAAAATARTPRPDGAPALPGLLAGELVLVSLGGALLATGGAPLGATVLALAVGGALVARTAGRLWRTSAPVFRRREALEPVLGGLLSLGVLAWTWPAEPLLHILLLWGLVPTTLVVMRFALAFTQKAPTAPPPEAPPPPPLPVRPSPRQTTLES